MFKNKKKKRNIIYLGILLLVISLTVGFSAFQNQLFINDMMLKVRLQRDVRVSESSISKTSNAVVNVEEFNKTKLLGNVTFDNTSSYVLYKVNLTNYGNVKSGLLKFENTNRYEAYFEAGNHIDSVSAATKTCRVTSATHCNITPPDVTPATGYFAAYWLNNANNAQLEIADKIKTTVSGRTYTAIAAAGTILTFDTMTSDTAGAQYASKYSSAQSVPTGFRNPTAIELRVNNATISPSNNPNLVIAVQYKVSGDSSWYTLQFDNDSPATYYWGTNYGQGVAGVFMGSRTSFTGTLTATPSKIPSNITSFRIRLYSSANAYGNAVVAMDGASLYIYATQ